MLRGLLQGSLTGREALARWLARRARISAGSFIALEEALLAGRFARYALRRLLAFGLARSLAVFVHLVELTWLFEIFSAKPFVASIALQNVTLVADAFFWGALEGYRRRARALGPSSEAAVLGSRWLSVASWVAVVAVGLPVAVAVAGAQAPSMLHVYAMICGGRLAADVLLRTYYSGVFAFRRVHRPIWSTLVGPGLLVTVTLLLWERTGGWSFVAALAIATAASRALLFAFTRRAYRRFRVPAPRLRPIARGMLGVIDRDALLGGGANLATRLGGVVLLAALVPSLTDVVGPDDELSLEPFAFALHLAAPFILAASQWPFVFYHDWKRVEADAAARLRQVLERRLVVTAVLIGVACAALSAALVLLYVPWGEAWPTLAALVGALTGLSIWTSLQLRRFSHGEHLRQVASALALVAVVVTALLAEDLGPGTFYAALAFGPWVAVAAHAALERLGRRSVHGQVDSIAAFLSVLEREAGEVIVWDARVARRPAAVAARVVARLAERGAVLRVRDRLIWFEREPFAGRADWLAAGGGQLCSLVRLEVPKNEARRVLASRGVLASPELGRDHDWLVKEHARLFPDGFVLRPGAPPPAAFVALPAPVRQAIWRDALRSRAGARGRSGFFVTCATAREGAPEVVFVAPRPVAQARSASWRNSMRSVEWRPAPASGSKLRQDRAIVEP